MTGRPEAMVLNEPGRTPRREIVTRDSATIEVKQTRVATTASADEVDKAIYARPVARWMYATPHHYLRHIPRLFRALGMSSFEAGGRHAPAMDWASRFGFRWGVQGNHEQVEAVLA